MAIDLGSSGIDAGIPLMLGGNVFGWTADRTASFAVLDRFVAGGGRLIDTADMYSSWVPGHSGGESETVIGDWLRARGGAGGVTVATKVGLLDGEGGSGLQPARIAAACDASLGRLGVEAIDLYFAHRDDPATPLAETLEALDRLVRAGKVRAIGASNYSAERLAEALALSDANGWARFTVLQPEYNLLERGFEHALQRLCVDQGIGVVPYFALASGYLTGKYRIPADVEGKPRGGTAQRYMDGNGPRMLAVMDAVAADTGASLPAIALAWLAAQPGVSAPIASATTPAQMDELLAAASLRLTDGQLARLDAAG